MTTEDAIRMVAAYAEHTPPGDHIRTMAPRMAGFDEGKAMRWLGFVQGVLVERGVFTLDDVMVHGRERRVPL